MGWRDDFIFILIMRTGNTSEIGLVFLMYGLALFSLRNFCSVLGLFFVGYVFTFSSMPVGVIGSRQAWAGEPITIILISDRQHIGGWPGFF